jgi:hypothetical protein
MIRTSPACAVAGTCHTYYAARGEKRKMERKNYERLSRCV